MPRSTWGPAPTVSKPLPILPSWCDELPSVLRRRDLLPWPNPMSSIRTSRLPSSPPWQPRPWDRHDPSRSTRPLHGRLDPRGRDHRDGLWRSGLAPDARKSPAPTAQSLAPAGYVLKVSDVISDCASHARGRVKVSFATLPCVKATRSLATGQISGRPALFVVSRIQMVSAEAAASIKQVLDGSETGNLNDLLREGKTFPGAPHQMPISGYTSVQTGTVVTVVEAGFSDGGPSASTDAALRASAAQVASTVSAQK